MLNQAQFMREFNETHRENFNPDLFKRNTQDIIDSIYQIVKSCERDKYFTLRLEKFEVIEDYEQIIEALKRHEENRRRKNDKTPNSYDFINIRDTDMALIRLIWFIRHNDMERQEINGVTKEVINPSTRLEVLVAVPRFVRDYYFRLSGNYYTATYQIVDGSTYNNSTASQSKVDTVTMKTMFAPIRIFRGFLDMTDLNTKQTYKVIEYSSIIFSNSVNVMYYLLAHFGLYGLFQFLDVHCVYLTTEPNTDPGYVCFCNNKSNIYISTPIYCFQEPIVQSICSTLYRGIGKDVDINTLFDIRYWIINLGAAYKNASIDKGLFVLDSIDGTYDNITKRDLHLPEEDKADIYCVLRWMIREFSNLRTKENVDVRMKRIRIADYIGQVYATKLNKGMYRISDLGRRVTLAKVVQAVYTQPMMLINSISTMSNLISYRDKVNDNDATTALKFTYKGISGLGEDGASIQDTYRFVDPTHIGILDLDTSSGSDPGMSGMICPMTNIREDHSFTEYSEPNAWRDSWKPIKDQFMNGATCPINFTVPEPEKSYYELRDQIVESELQLHKIICPVRDLTDANYSYAYDGVDIDNSGTNVDSSEVMSLFNISEDGGIVLSEDDDDSEE